MRMFPIVGALLIALLVVSNPRPLQAQTTAYSNQMALAVDATFMARVKIAMVKAAIAIKNESTGTAGHVSRTSYASDVLASPDGQAGVMAKGIVTQSPVSTSITVTNGVATTTALDSDIDSIVSALWNAYARGALP